MFYFLYNITETVRHEVLDGRSCRTHGNLKVCTVFVMVEKSVWYSFLTWVSFQGVKWPNDGDLRIGDKHFRGWKTITNTQLFKEDLKMCVYLKLWTPTVYIININIYNELKIKLLILLCSIITNNPSVMLVLSS